MGGDQLTDELQVGLGYLTAPVAELDVHAPDHNRIENGTQVLCRRLPASAQWPGLTRRQAAGACAPAGLPAASSTCSSWASRRWQTPLGLSGQKRKRPRDKRFWHSQNPCESYTRILRVVALRLRNTNRQPEKGSVCSTSWQTRARPSIPRRRSTASTATRMRIWGVIWIMACRSRISGPGLPDPGRRCLSNGSSAWRRRGSPVPPGIREPEPTWCRLLGRGLVLVPQRREGMTFRPGLD